MGHEQWRLAKEHATEHSAATRQKRYDEDLARAANFLKNFFANEETGGEALGMLLTCNEKVRIYVVNGRWGYLTGNGFLESDGRDNVEKLDMSRVNGYREIVEYWLGHPDPELKLENDRKPEDFMHWLVVELDKIAAEELKKSAE